MVVAYLGSLLLVVVVNSNDISEIQDQLRIRLIKGNFKMFFTLVLLSFDDDHKVEIIGKCTLFVQLLLIVPPMFHCLICGIVV